MERLSDRLGMPFPVSEGAVENALPQDAGLEMTPATRKRVHAFYAGDFALHKRGMQA
ncbi:hypothetical protein [Thalassovita taeanensis]|uniref:Uncharacterized protein n=1 Tax=Thalassovita taeanensis TaxID=657014 RepID=A0A1H9L0N7_9RHOB|nr:hypothetical protein [Thalassovita taeanensis]SER04819.1 hypothetical protein SAMN04488092_1226 [Thalassovita taeanensis]